MIDFKECSQNIKYTQLYINVLITEQVNLIIIQLAI